MLNILKVQGSGDAEEWLENWLRSSGWARPAHRNSVLEALERSEKSWDDIHITARLIVSGLPDAFLNEAVLAAKGLPGFIIVSKKAFDRGDLNVLGAVHKRHSRECAWVLGTTFEDWK